MKDRLLKIGLELAKSKNITTSKELFRKLEPWLIENGAIKLDDNNYLFAAKKGGCALTTWDLWGFNKIE